MIGFVQKIIIREKNISFQYFPFFSPWFRKASFSGLFRHEIVWLRADITNKDDGYSNELIFSYSCPVYNNLPSNQCYLQKANGECCAQPLCYDPNTGSMVNPMTSSSVFPVVGTYSGGFSGFRPVTPGSTFGSRGLWLFLSVIFKSYWLFH